MADALRFLVLPTSLDPNSRSRALAGRAAGWLREAGHDAELLDLRELPLPAFDNAAALEDPNVARFNEALSAADGIVLAAPVYNWSLGGGLKNLVEITGSTDDGRRTPWFDKVVTFLVAGGLPHSYMAHLPLANALTLDFKCVVNPYHLYATERDFPPGGEPNEKTLRRLDRTLSVAAELSTLLRSRTYASGWEI